MRRDSSIIYEMSGWFVKVSFLEVACVRKLVSNFLFLCFLLEKLTYLNHNIVCYTFFKVNFAVFLLKTIFYQFILIFFL